MKQFYNNLTWKLYFINWWQFRFSRDWVLSGPSSRFRRRFTPTWFYSWSYRMDRIKRYFSRIRLSGSGLYICLWDLGFISRLPMYHKPTLNYCHRLFYASSVPLLLHTTLSPSENNFYVCRMKQKETIVCNFIVFKEL